MSCRITTRWWRFGGMVDGYGIASKAGTIIAQGTFNGLEDEAVARLIAAAPDLLSVCKALLQYLIESEDDNITKIIAAQKTLERVIRLAG